MLDMGFLRDIERILKVLQKRQNLIFQRPFKDIKKLAMGILHKPVQVEATPEKHLLDVSFRKKFLL
jgi:ATP-dependent RNA helicase RhlE